MSAQIPPFARVQRVSFLKDLCRGQSVLHLGCTNWPYQEQSSGDDRFLHAALMPQARELWGIDGDAGGLAALESQGVSDLYHGDLEKLDQLNINRTFDIIVAGEVIEHLSNPGLFLNGVQRFMRHDTILAITTVNAYCAFRMAIYGIRGRGGHAEPVHPDHVSYYSYRTLTHVAKRSGLVLDKFFFYDLGKEHRPFTRASIRMINDVAVRLAPQLSDGIIGLFRLPEKTGA